MKNIPSAELLEATHQFPGTYQIRAIGAAEGDFAGRVVLAVKTVLGNPDDLEHSIRRTPGGGHEAVTIDVLVRDAEQVRSLYAEIHEVAGLVLLF